MFKKLETKPKSQLAVKSRIKRRVNGIIFVVVLAFVFWIIWNLLSVSVVNSESYQTLANEFQFGTISIPANRGTIYDCNNNILAQSATVFKIFVDPSQFKNNDSEKESLIVSKLSGLLGIDAETVKKKLTNTSSKYEVLKTKVEKPIKDQIVEFIENEKLSCINYEEDTKRYYPQNELAASVIGFTNGDGKGQYGIENYYDKYLSGTEGRVISAKDAKGEEMPYKYTKQFEAKDGSDVHLTIDNTIQYYLEKSLAKVVKEQKVEERACGIIMNCKTGAILGMASVPGFDLNNPSEISDENVLAYLKTLKDDQYQQAYVKAREAQWKNKCITEIYYPGSVFKVITGSAAIEEKVINAKTSFTCHDVNISGTPFHCWKAGGHGTQNFFDALANSCNPAFIDIGTRLGADKFFKYFDAFGLTKRTGIDLPAEATSLYQGREGMGPVELASCSFGQTNKITPIEMITAYAATVNGGYLLKPYVVSKIVNKNGDVVLNNDKNVIRQVISNETSSEMCNALEYVVNTKGGSNAYIKGYRIGGKSGTSQKQDENNKQNRTDLYVSSYCCFYPANDPEIIMLVLVDEPMAGNYYASIVVSPVAREVFGETLPYLGYYPEYTEEERKTLDIKVPQLEDKTISEAKTALGDKLKYEIFGSGDRVAYQVPAFGNSMPVGGKVFIYTQDNSKEEETVVPKVLGKNLAEANVLLSNAGLNYTTEGASPSREDSVVLQQSYPEGTKLPKGSIVSLTFAVYDQSG